MSFEHDEDSQMISSPEDSDNDTSNHGQHSVPSPPDSTHRFEDRSTSQIQPVGTTSGNSNGKRPLNDISNGKDHPDELVAAASNKPRQDYPTKTHGPSGYTWSRAEDEPGYAWMNKKALDERQRALENIVQQDCVINSKYGDPFEIAAKEEAMLQAAEHSKR